ncbi:glycosyltransferase family 4 protein [Pseudomaricurvus alkylphenolicus]|uniref:glycosyltransferase family 4 protein n=1 Tax=Pseudomaricurvus alkylphenolicus TaxID=1306991 RepID=UPI00141E9F96|nr:glycosyltransferase family 1 protein [Pseudomaricurvus alkylphenolicus]NIB42082.1 glycosyltransferase family 4 protein [Pseudomaricurvus alkylphenolicus]
MPNPINLLVNVDCLRSELTGIGHYTHNLLVELIKDPAIGEVKGISALGQVTQDELMGLLKLETSEGEEARAEASSVSGFKAKTLGLAIRAARHVPYARTLAHHWRSRMAKAQQANIEGFLYWEPNYTLLPVNNRAVTTICDISHVRYPEFHPAERIELMERLLPETFQRSDQILTISEFTRDELVDYYGLRKKDIAIVPPAVSPEFRPRAASECESVRKRYNLPEQFVMSLGTLEPRKNLVGLIEAYAQLPNPLREQYPLVITGGDGWRRGKIEDALKQLPQHQLIRTGYVDQQDLPLIISCATLMAYPSFYEGFGMPVLEAMASGVPVLTSNLSSMPEVCDGSGILVDPHRVESIAEGLSRVLENEQLRLEKQQAGLAVASRYSWQNSAAMLRDVFVQVQSR